MMVGRKCWSARGVADDTGRQIWEVLRCLDWPEEEGAPEVQPA